MAHVCTFIPLFIKFSMSEAFFELCHLHSLSISF
jgi:hypothetical protein